MVINLALPRNALKDTINNWIFDYKISDSGIPKKEVVTLMTIALFFTAESAFAKEYGKPSYMSLGDLTYVSIVSFLEVIKQYSYDEIKSVLDLFRRFI